MDLIEKMYVKDEKSISEISRELKISRDRVRKYLNKKDIDTNKRRNQYGFNNVVSNNLFKTINKEEDAYWLGFLYADGNIRVDRNEISLTLQENDKDAVQSFHLFCGNKNSIRRNTIKRNGREYISYTSSFSSEEVKANLIKRGCTPQKSFSLSFPTEEQVPKDFLYDFLRGYIDGDGYIQYDINKSRYRIIILGTYEFLTGLIKRTGWSIGSKIYKNKKENIFRLELSRKELVKERLEKLYKNSTCHLLRKYKIYLNSSMGA